MMCGWPFHSAHGWYDAFCWPSERRGISSTFFLVCRSHIVLHFVLGKKLPLVEIHKFCEINEISKKEFKKFDQIWSLVVIFILQNLMFIWGFELTTSKTNTAHSTTILAPSEWYRNDVFVLIRIAIWDFSNSDKMFGQNYVFSPLTEIHKFRKIRLKFWRFFFPVSHLGVLLTRPSAKMPIVLSCEHHRKGLIVNTRHVDVGTLMMVTVADLAVLSRLAINVVFGWLDPDKKNQSSIRVLIRKQGQI
jgi:hypothetical protein